MYVCILCMLYGRLNDSNNNNAAYLNTQIFSPALISSLQTGSMEKAESVQLLSTLLQLKQTNTREWAMEIEQLKCPKKIIPRIMMHEDREWVAVQACGSSSTGCTAPREQVYQTDGCWVHLFILPERWVLVRMDLPQYTTTEFHGGI